MASRSGVKCKDRNSTDWLQRANSARASRPRRRTPFSMRSLQVCPALRRRQLRKRRLAEKTSPGAKQIPCSSASSKSARESKRFGAGRDPPDTVAGRQAFRERAAVDCPIPRMGGAAERFWRTTLMEHALRQVETDKTQRLEPAQNGRRLFNTVVIDFDRRTLVHGNPRDRRCRDSRCQHTSASRPRRS